ncbi:microtubule-associated protein 4-like isoform X1 [Conger conger]|uniref:microtubule-associated protein 4-like isoform X1 n=1 Tax=Conger conger TaxID=82655 RepID=UPI002A59BEA2|nr:microtubule-associated protein 4-like isoform X1 [Conger conger]XP_061109982.1 microtubule-associated protein 4-like isoform X1 [Conger conger]XP_061109983.1 microtubule-associated protein 4-like isoform X1 [Conger conger]XP_061109984.1 microtubule-associated protein 4-like isoform X1 [Conger conger]
MDLSLTDALTDGVAPQSGSEDLLQRDFVAALEAESFDDKVGETVGKTDYCPLLDEDGKKEGSGMMPSGQTPYSQDLQGEMWSFQAEQQAMNADFLSGSISVGGLPGQWGTQPMVPEVKASSLTDPFTGVSQQGVEVMNMDVGMALSTARPPSMAEPQQPPLLIASEPPKLAQMPDKPNEQNPFESPLDFLNAPDTTAGVPGDHWAGEGGLQADLPITPSDSTVISCHADEMADFSPEHLGADECHQQGGGVGEERGNEGGGGRRQKKKKKRRQREEMYDVLELQGPQDENHSPTGAYPGMDWELDEGGRIGARGKKGKSRKRIPEEWSAPQDLPQGPDGDPDGDPWSTNAQSQESPQDSPTHEEAQESPSTPSTLSSEAPPSVLASLDSYLAAGADACDPSMETDIAPLPSDQARPSDSLQEGQLLEKAESVEDLSDFRSLLQPSTKGVHVSSVPPLSQTPNPFQVPSPTETAVPAPVPPLSPAPCEDSLLVGYSSPPTTAETPGPKGDLVSADLNEPLPLSPSLAPQPSSQTPPFTSSSSALSGSFPMVSSALNPTAPPFFPSQSDFGEPRLEDWRADEGPALPSVTEVKTEKADKPENVEKMDSFPKMEKLDMFGKTEKLEMRDTPEKAEKMDSLQVNEKRDAFEKTDELEMLDKERDLQKADKEEELEKDKTEEDKKEKDKPKEDKPEEDKTQKDKIEKDESEKIKVEKDEPEKDKIEKDKPVKDKPEKANQQKTNKATEKPQKKENGMKTSKVTEKVTTKAAGRSAAAIGTRAAPGKDLPSPDKKTKPAVGPARPSSAKTRPTSLPSGPAAPKRPLPTSSTSSAPSKKIPAPTKANTPPTGAKRPMPPAASRPTSTTHEAKPKTERPPVSKANTVKSSTPKNGSPATTTTSKPAGVPRVPLSNRTASSAPSLRRTTLPKTENKAGETKKLSTLKTTTADSSRPRSSPGTGVSSMARSRPTKPPTPASTVPDRKAPGPRAPRSSARPSTGPSPDIKNARSKIGSTDNMKHQPGGGKVSSAQGRTDTLAKCPLSKETSQGKVQIVNKKADFSHITSRCGSKDNMKHVPGGGNIQILNKKVDLSKVTKCGTKDNIKNKPGSGDVKIQSHKVNNKVPSKAGSMDNMNHESKDSLAKGDGAPSSGAQDTAPEIIAQDNGLTQTASLVEGFWDPQGPDTRIPETN